VPDGVEADPVVVAELAEGLAGRRLGGLHAGPVVGVPDGVVLALGGCAAPGRGGGGRRLLDPLHQQGHVAVVAAPVDRDLVRARRVVDLAAGVVAADLDPVPPPVALVHLDVGVAGAVHDLRHEGLGARRHGHLVLVDAPAVAGVGQVGLLQQLGDAGFLPHDGQVGPDLVAVEPVGIVEVGGAGLRYEGHLGAATDTDVAAVVVGVFAAVAAREGDVVAAGVVEAREVGGVAVAAGDPRSGGLPPGLVVGVRVVVERVVDVRTVVDRVVHVPVVLVAGHGLGHHGPGAVQDEHDGGRRVRRAGLQRHGGNQYVVRGCPGRARRQRGQAGEQHHAEAGTARCPTRRT